MLTYNKNRQHVVSFAKQLKQIMLKNSQIKEHYIASQLRIACIQHALEVARRVAKL